MLPESGSTCLYLGASTGGTVSHIHDHVCGAGNHHGGHIVAVDISPRMMRDLVKLSEKRSGLTPVLADARKPMAIAPYMREKATWLHQDLSIGDQAETFVKMTGAFLAQEGVALLSLKAASERWMEGGDDARFEHSKRIIEECEHLELIETIDISVFEEQHVVFFCIKK
jgi:fibrillarin-like rRNA methylase